MHAIAKLSRPPPGTVSLDRLLQLLKVNKSYSDGRTRKKKSLRLKFCPQPNAFP